MKNQLLNIKAAILYLLIFQADEEQVTLGNWETINKWLQDNDFPTDPVYDNEGIPQITWKETFFDCETFYELIEYNPNHELLTYNP